MAQAEFDKQAEITKLLLEGIQTAHVSSFSLLPSVVLMINVSITYSGKHKLLVIHISVCHLNFCIEPLTALIRQQRP